MVSIDGTDTVFCRCTKVGVTTDTTRSVDAMSRRRTSSGRPLLVLGVAALLVAAAVAGVIATTGFSLVQADRTVEADVVPDGYGALKMAITECVVDGKKTQLIAATNLLGVDATMTVSLHQGSVGTLYAAGGSGDTVTFSLGVGQTEEVDFKSETGGTFPQTFDYDIDTAATPISMSGVRSATIEKNKCDGSGGTNTPPTADFTYDRKGKGSKIQLDGSASSDPDSSIETWEWDYDADGTIDATGKKINTNLPAGTDVTLIVTDDLGASDSVTKTV